MHWLKTCCLQINTTKIVAVFFSTKLTSNLRRLTIINHPIIWLNHTKYLGLIIDRHFRFVHHISKVIKKANRIRGMLSPLLNKKITCPSSEVNCVTDHYLSTFTQQAPGRSKLRTRGHSATHSGQTYAVIQLPPPPQKNQRATGQNPDRNRTGGNPAPNLPSLGNSTMGKAKRALLFNLP